MKNLFAFGLSFLTALGLTAQCGTWNDAPDKDQLETYHVLYQQALELEDYEEAYANWSKVFAVAPAADGQRIAQYLEGAKIMGERFKNAADKAVKDEAKQMAYKVYDQLVECYKAGSLPCKSDGCKAEIGFAYGRKAFDMFYIYNELYSKTLEAIDLAVEYGGVENEYIIFAPAASIAAYNIKNGTMEKDKAVQLYTSLNEIADHNINKEDHLSDYFLQAKENMNGTFATIEDEIFDCEYFKEKLTPDYESDPENPDILKYIIVTLKKKGCPEDDEFLVSLEQKWEKYATEFNAQKQAEFEANNPAIVAKKLYDEGKYQDAVQKYDEAIDAETDPEKKASYLFSQASILFRKLSSYSAARGTAYEAAKLKEGWGRPYMLIGDMYAKSARSCGDDWNQRLAILAAIDKYQYAKSIDPSLESEANKRIGNYAGSMPDQSTGFMMGIKEGATAKVGCWIGETVKVRYK